MGRTSRLGTRRLLGVALALAAFAGLALASCDAGPSRVVVGYPEVPDAIHPHRGGSEYAQSIGGNVYEALVSRDGDLSFGPGLARSWRRKERGRDLAPCCPGAAAMILARPRRIQSP
jgi:ABC-type transport system substrate-binding protein